MIARPPTIRVRLQRHLLDPIPQGWLNPIEQVRALAHRIRQRVHVEGRQASGAAWSAYRESGAWYWVPAGQPQPEQHRIVVARRGPRAGQAAYPSWRAYRSALGADTDRKRFRLSGFTARELEAVEHDDRRSSYGYSDRLHPRARMPVSQLVSEMAERERSALVDPAKDEIELFENELAATVPERLTGGHSDAGAPTLTNRPRRAQRRVTRGGL